MCGDITTLTGSENNIEGLEITSRLCLENAYHYCRNNDLVANNENQTNHLLKKKKQSGRISKHDAWTKGKTPWCDY